MNTKQELTIFIGQKGIDMVKAHNGNEDKQPAGALFHDVKWSKKPFGTVTFQHGAQSFTLPTVLSVMSFTDTLYEEDGIQEFDITAGISPEEFINHQEAYKRIFAFVDSLLAKGWQAYQSPAGAMLRGKDALRYYLNDPLGQLLDLRVKPSFEQWMKANSSTPLFVNLYANGVVLSITVRRERDKLDPNQLGQYVYSITLKSATAEMRMYTGAGNVSPEEAQAKSWIKLWPAKLAELEKIKQEDIAELTKQGYTVDTSYKHPDWSPWLK